MKLSFRQGIVQHQPGFVYKSANNVYITTQNSPLVFSVSHGTAEYLITEPTIQTPISAWPNIPLTSTSWLYIDINKNNTTRTFGVTTVEPVVGPSNPFPPLDTIHLDQHWFDTSLMKMRVWNGTQWVEAIRIIIATVVNGTSLQPKLIGSQVGVYGSFNSGKILYDGYGKPLKKIR